MRGLGIKRAKQQRANELDVSRFIEGCNFDALTQHFDAIIALRRQDGGKSLEQQLPPLTKTVPLACQPVVEQWSPVDGEAFEKVATEQCSERLKILRRPAGQRRLRVARKRDGIDVERTGVDPDPLTVGDEPGRCGPVDQWPQLGKAPAQLAFRVIGDIPKQLAELFAGDRARRHREISEERPGLARARQRQRGSVPNDLERSQQEHAVRRRARHFHARSNVCSNAGRVWLLSREAGLRHRRAPSER